MCKLHSTLLPRFNCLVRFSEFVLNFFECYELFSFTCSKNDGTADFIQHDPQGDLRDLWATETMGTGEIAHYYLFVVRVTDKQMEDFKSKWIFDFSFLIFDFYQKTTKMAHIFLYRSVQFFQ